MGERAWEIQLEFRCSSCPMESRCGRGGACVWWGKEPWVLHCPQVPHWFLPQDPCQVCSGLQFLLRCLLDFVSWAWSEPCDPSWLTQPHPGSHYRNSPEHPLVLYPTPDRLNSPQSEWQDDLISCLLTSVFPMGYVGTSTCFPWHRAVMGRSRTRESKLSPFSGLSAWSEQGHSHSWEDPGLWAPSCSSRHSSAFFPCVAVSSQRSNRGWQKSPVLLAFLSTYLRCLPFLRVRSREGRLLRLACLFSLLLGLSFYSFLGEEWTLAFLPWNE